MRQSGGERKLLFPKRILRVDLEEIVLRSSVRV